MAKLLKSNEPNTWKVLDDHYIGKSGTVETNDDEMLELGEVWFDGREFVFIPETENGVEHTSDHLRDIADLMDALEAEQAKAAVVGK